MAVKVLPHCMHRAAKVQLRWLVKAWMLHSELLPEVVRWVLAIKHALIAEL